DRDLLERIVERLRPVHAPAAQRVPPRRATTGRFERRQGPNGVEPSGLRDVERVSGQPAVARDEAVEEPQSHASGPRLDTPAEEDLELVVGRPILAPITR